MKINVEKMFLKSVDHAPIPLHPQQVDYFKGVCRAIDAAIRASRKNQSGKGA